jgi:nucleotide-binding universal stress UspA family protein
MNVLVLVLDTAGPVDVRDAEILVVAPALNSRLRHWLSDEDGARRQAGERADACVDRLERAGAHVRGSVGDADPVQAIADALVTFQADEIVIAADRERPHRLTDNLAARARKRFALPILQPSAEIRHAA